MSNMVVRTNVFALNSHRNMKNVGADQQRASARLASGYRINNAADDAAGLAISESMRAQIRGLDQASRNSQDGQALINTAEGGMQEIQNMLQRVRELTVQASNDTNEDANRNQIALEIGQLLEEIGSMSDRVQFNGMQLIDGTWTNKTGSISGGGGAPDPALENLQKLQTALKAFTHTDAFDGAGNAGPFLALETALGLTAPGGGWNIDPTDGTDGIFKAIEDLTGIDLTGLELHDGTGGAAAFDPIMNPFLTAVQTAIDALPAAPGSGGSAGNLTKGSEITELIDMVGAGIEFVSLSRARLGAVSNRLDFTSRSLDVSSENLSDAESRVRNTDMAKEMMRFTMANVLQQAAVSMLSQANQLPNNLLQLLR